MNIRQPQQLPFLEFLGWQITDVYPLTQLEMLASDVSNMVVYGLVTSLAGIFSRLVVCLRRYG
ncbi:hypothetical protein [Chamaesiphon sp. OTE_75_metabat_556]|uniref:hypothetical protein n=1 Tax=Chamaesiphon sp. OTE_75_metabat_556 TaxID=2964692 RepID=UPI00286C2CFB|nr:hypothetical protein [Chamaesiphon sp. OTE_75_metabat_556]